MNYCNKCRFYQKTLFVPPKCTRISNYHLLKKKDVPFSIEESFRICKGYFFEKKSGESSDEPAPPSSGH